MASKKKKSDVTTVQLLELNDDTFQMGAGWILQIKGLKGSDHDELTENPKQLMLMAQKSVLVLKHGCWGAIPRRQCDLNGEGHLKIRLLSVERLVAMIDHIDHVAAELKAMSTAFKKDYD